MTAVALGALGAGAVAVLLASAVRRLRRQRAERRLRAWAAAHPHVVALVADVGPAAGMLLATVGEDVVRRWWAEQRAMLAAGEECAPGCPVCTEQQEHATREAPEERG